LADQILNAAELPRKHEFGIRRRDAGTSKSENVPALTINELARAIDFRPNGCNVRHGHTFRNYWTED